MKNIVNNVIKAIQSARTQNVKIIEIADPKDCPYAFASRDLDDKETLQDHFEGTDLIHPLVLIKRGDQLVVAIGKRRWKGLVAAKKSEVLCKILNEDDFDVNELRSALRSISLMESAFTRAHSNVDIFKHFREIRQSLKGSPEVWQDFRRTFGIDRKHEHYRTLLRLFEAAGNDAACSLIDRELLAVDHLTNEVLVSIVSDGDFEKIVQALHNKQTEVQLEKDSDDRLAKLNVSSADILKCVKDAIGASDKADKPNGPLFAKVSDRDGVLSVPSVRFEKGKISLQEAIDWLWNFRQVAIQLTAVVNAKSSDSIAFTAPKYGDDYLKFLKEHNALGLANIERAVIDCEILSKKSVESLDVDYCRSQLEAYIAKKAI